MPKIILSTIPELRKLVIINDQEDLKNFLGKLRQDWYSPANLKGFRLVQELAGWLKISKPSSVTFFAVRDEKDDHAKNDNWGKYELFRCVAIRTHDGKIHLLKTLVKEFLH